VRFTIESWDPSYGISADDGALDPAGQPVDAGVEVRLDRWRPLTPTGTAPDTVLFVDGVQRIDTRVWIDDGTVSHPAICATVAAGAVRSEPGAATVTAIEVARVLLTSVPGAEPIVARRGSAELRYQVRTTGADDDPTFYRGLHDHMTDLERSLSAEMDGVELVVFDGPLRGRELAAGVGYVKTQHVQYLEPAQHRVVAALGDGQRTPLFRIGDRFARWSWYLRLPGPRSHALSGIVRLELPGLGGVADAVERAETVSAALPRYASRPHREARAPQNLYPIAGLERELRRRLGDVRFIDRTLRAASRPPVTAGAASPVGG
jgi:hypothetical protein